LRRNLLKKYTEWMVWNLFLKIWLRMYIHTKCPTRCNTSILMLLQDHSTCFAYFPCPSSGAQSLQLTATGTTYVTLDREPYGNVGFKNCPRSGGWSHHCGWVRTQHVQWSCNKNKILVLHLVGHFVCKYIQNDARNHEPKIHLVKKSPVLVQPGRYSVFPKTCC
jgi:hypothetical protein